jgi:hypothetical protein
VTNRHPGNKSSPAPAAAGRLRFRGKIVIHRGGKGGALVAVADVVDVVTPEEALHLRPDQREHICGPWCWLLDNVQKVECVA